MYIYIYIYIYIHIHIHIHIFHPPLLKPAEPPKRSRNRSATSRCSLGVRDRPWQEMNNMKTDIREMKSESTMLTWMRPAYFFIS